MKIFKTLLLAAVGIVVLIVIVIAIVAATFDPNKYKPEIVAAVKDKTGRTLAIEGNLGLSFFPGIGIAVGRASLSEANSSRIFARVEQAKIALALWPLLSKRVVVDRVTLSGLALDLVQGKGGRTNFEDLAGSTAAGPWRMTLISRFVSPATIGLPAMAGCMEGTPLPLGMWHAAQTAA